MSSCHAMTPTNRASDRPTNRASDRITNRASDRISDRIKNRTKYKSKGDINRIALNGTVVNEYPHNTLAINPIKIIIKLVTGYRLGIYRNTISTVIAVYISHIYYAVKDNQRLKPNYYSSRNNFIGIFIL